MPNIEKDYRLPEHRLEAFTRSYYWRRETGDLDHTHGAHIICDDLGLDDDGRAWFSLLFGHTYRNPMALIYVKNFPEFASVRVDHIQKWTDSNWRRLIYGKDCRWQIGKLPAIIAGMKKWLGKDNIGARFRELAVDSQEKNFYKVLNAIRELPYFGRMTSWLAMQALYDTIQLPINHPDLLMKDDNSWSPYNGLCYLYNKAGFSRSKEHTPTLEEIDFMQRKLLELIEHMQEQLPYQEIDIFRLETHLCEFRKWVSDPPKEYIGWNSAEMNTLYLKYCSYWPEIDFTPFLKGLMTLDKSIRGLGYSKRLFTIFKNTGLMLNLDDVFPDMPNVYQKLGIKKEKLLLESMFQDFGDGIKTASNYHPTKYEKYRKGFKRCLK